MPVWVVRPPLLARRAVAGDSLLAPPVDHRTVSSMSTPALRTLPLGLVEHFASYYERASLRTCGVDVVDELATFAVISPQDLAQFCAELLSHGAEPAQVASRALSDLRVVDATQLGIAHALCAYASGSPGRGEHELVAQLHAADPKTLTAAAAAADSLITTAHRWSKTQVSLGEWLRATLMPYQ